jgi:dihydroflavonol-4-reductase
LLVEHGHDVVAVSRTGGIAGGVRVGTVDVLDPDAVYKSAARCEGAFLVTGKVSRRSDDTEELHRLHVTGTRSALVGLRAAGVRRVVVASTSGTIAVGSDPNRIYDESSLAPFELISRWPYYRTKYYAEQEALEANDPPQFEVVIANPSLLLGPGDHRESSTGDVRRFLERAIPAIPSGGIAFVDVRDAAVGMLAAFERGQPGERYLLNSKNLTIAAFLQRLERITGVAAPRLRLPRSRTLALGLNSVVGRALRAMGTEPPIDDVSLEMAQYFWYCNAAKAEERLSWAPRDPGETLRDTVQDLIERRVAFPKRTRMQPHSLLVERSS